MISRYSDCHLAEIMDDPEDFGGAKRPMCSFCGKKWPEIVQERGVDGNLELALRRWKDGDMPTKDLIAYIQNEFDLDFWNITKHIRKQLQKRKKPMYTYSVDRMKWELTAPIETNKEGEK